MTMVEAASFGWGSRDSLAAACRLAFAVLDPFRIVGQLSEERQMKAQGGSFTLYIVMQSL